MGALEIAGALAASRKAVRLYPPEHPTHREAVRDLVAAVTASVDIRPLVLNLSNGRLYEASEVITEASPATRALAEAMESRRVESLTFHMGFAEVDAEGLSEVLSMRPSPDLQVQAELDAREVRGVTVSELEDNSSREAEERDRQREADRALYRHSLSALQTITTGLAENKVVDASEAMRTIAALIERIAEDQNAMLSLATMTGHGERSRFHAVSVMLHSLVLGFALGLPDRQLLSVGLAGLLHDVGFTLQASADEETARREHPTVGALALGAIPDEDCVAVIAAYEHHMGADLSGWPVPDGDYRTHPYSRIVSIADRYDNLMRPTVGRAMRPDEAAAQLLREASGGPLDPLMTRVFVQTTGVLPVTTVVRLSDFSIGIVRAPGEHPLQPQVRLVLKSDGTELRPALDIDAEDERAIVEVIPAALVGLHPSDYL